jgi:hypothetical protein
MSHYRSIHFDFIDEQQSRCFKLMGVLQGHHVWDM